jgi:alpha-glucosidase
MSPWWSPFPLWSLTLSISSSPSNEWWRGAVIYQIYPRSFFDADNNGIGDIGGIAAKLDEIASLGVDCLWISPFFKSPMADFGYDVEDYRDVDPIFGSLENFKTLLAEAHKRDLKILIDLVMSHTSERHAWFQESKKSRDNPKADWYVWADANPTGNPPNNWLSMFGGSAWEWDTTRRQYFLHNFLKVQPDLNFHNAQVQDAVLDTAKFWLDLGVDGFRLDVVNYYFHDAKLRDNPPKPAGVQMNTVPPSNPYGYQDHLYDKQQPENLVFLERFRQLLDQYPGAMAVGELGIDKDVGLITEEYTEKGKRLQLVYSFQLMADTISAPYVRDVVSAMDKDVTSGWVCWAVSNHDFPRVISRWGYEDVADRAAPMLMAMLSSLKGSPCFYQGEELGLVEADVPFEKLQDPYGKAFWPAFKGRDGCRTPYPWSRDAPHGGFSKAEPWLPMSDAQLPHAFDVQDADPASALNKVRKFLAWRRKQPALYTGAIRFLDTPEPVLAFLRETAGETLLCLFNLGRDAVTVDLPGLGTPELLADSGFSASFKDGKAVLEPLGAAFARVQK